VDAHKPDLVEVATKQVECGKDLGERAS